MTQSLTRLRGYERDNHSLRGFRAAASLHCHTHHSKEVLNFIPHYVAMIPVISRLFNSEMDRYLTVHGNKIDFASVWWTPPVSPRQVFEVETFQIESRLGLSALVSITDHDDIEAGLRLQALDAARRIPVSLEWTTPFGEGFFHLGVHNLPQERAIETVGELLKYTERSASAMTLRDLLASLNESPQTLVVLNHPLWDIEFIGAERHARCLRAFLAEHGQWIHALEINGFRSWRENQAVINLAEEIGLPVVTGGDRHGWAANTMLNLTRADSFEGLVAEIREDSRSEILIMPEYRESLIARTIGVVADVLRHYPNHPLGRSRWTDRVFMKLDENGAECPDTYALSHYWPNGGPKWVRAALWLLRMLGSREIRPALSLALGGERVSFDKMGYEGLTELQGRSL
jgi:phage-related protein